MVRFDEKDREILKILRKNGRITLTELGRELGLSPASVKNRIDKLRELGAIQGFSAVVDPSFLDRYVRVFMLLKLKAEDPEVDRILSKFAVLDNVQTIYRTTGRTQALIIAEFEDMDEMKRFAGRLKHSLGSLLEYIEWGTIYDSIKECWTDTKKRGGSHGHKGGHI
ncbi:MAG: Lrp/AsnC family transcriptional regulator [Thermococcus sp.]|uniref:AsnC family transcriptional regulator n=1 Tax=Thermococcus guaymasensis DSM 11113 TaxID=1432656 RepID=A0A0X1KLZ5_9EURY|nr:Lrp/AsnC family transcriptional regulator [Thermococcus guaymasensis]AJC72255.1 AsnC family transcriptional regulator [Thermococcus guaymasensis DSM 11113]MCD6524699.1 Lrp/AsnC family transcriptional regulator [Thermococcus sp.]